MSSFDISRFRNFASPLTRYQRRITALTDAGKHTKSIEDAVEKAVENVGNEVRSFVIYGEPQSGKTEMMIALTARLLDEGHRVIVVLLNDNVQLLEQNLDRFRRSGLNPAPKNFAEILDKGIRIGTNEWVIFCKKNSSDLRKLIIKLEHTGNKVIIDDEADFATPNAKINKGEQTKINELIGNLLDRTGIYIGVTATPARLNLNNTFGNLDTCWVDFPPHPLYTGQEVFFPTELVGIESMKFGLRPMPSTDDSPRYLREAIASFMVNVAHLNTTINENEKDYSMLVHTSGKKADHSVDYDNVVDFFNALNQAEDNRDFVKHVRLIWEIAQNKFPGEEDQITKYILQNKNRSIIVVMNSDTDKKTVDYTSATNPCSIFTLAIGGNIISRGITFDNLLSMFFTRDVKHKIQQDTYIQRARMFGSRGEYLEYFELYIPETLYYDWHRCFVFHRLSIESIRAGKGFPVWLQDQRIAVAAASSIDKTTVVMDSGEMSFELFDIGDANYGAIDNLAGNGVGNAQKLQQLVGESRLPQYLLDFITQFSPDGDESVAIHPISSIAGYKDADIELIERSKGFIGNPQLEPTKYPKAVHHFKVFENGHGKARVFYKYGGNISFVKNLKRKLSDGQRI